MSKTRTTAQPLRRSWGNAENLADAPRLAEGALLLVPLALALELLDRLLGGVRFLGALLSRAAQCSAETLHSAAAAYLVYDGALVEHFPKRGRDPRARVSAYAVDPPRPATDALGRAWAEYGRLALCLRAAAPPAPSAVDPALENV